MSRFDRGDQKFALSRRAQPQTGLESVPPRPPLFCLTVPTLLPGPQKIESQARGSSSSRRFHSIAETQQGTFATRAKRKELRKRDLGVLVVVVVRNDDHLDHATCLFTLFSDSPFPRPRTSARTCLALKHDQRHRLRTCTATATPGTTTRCFTMGSLTARGGSNLECVAQTWTARTSGTAALSTATLGN